jgi:hypothetical protein
VRRRTWYVLGAIVALNVVATMVATMVETAVVYVAWAILADSIRGEL